MENTESCCFFMGYRISFVIFAFFLLSGFVIGTALFKTGFGFKDNILIIPADTVYSENFKDGKDIPENTAKAENAENSSKEKTFEFQTFKMVLHAFFLNFRYLIIIFLCGFTVFSPLLSIFCVTYRGVIFGFSSSLLYCMIQSGAKASATVFAVFPRLAFIICFIAGAVNIVLCLNMCCISSEFAYLLRHENSGFRDIMVYERAGKYTLCILFAAFIQLCVSLFCCLFSGIVI